MKILFKESVGIILAAACSKSQKDIDVHRILRDRLSRKHFYICDNNI